MIPEPNKYGVFMPTEIIEHTTPAGAYLRIELVQCEDGWREGIGHRGLWSGGGYMPSAVRPARKDRGDALDFARGLLRRVFDCPGWHELSDKEIAQRDEVIAWVDGFKQQELFA